MFIFRSLQLCCLTITLAVLFLDCCVLQSGCGSAGVVSGLSTGVRSTFPHRKNWTCYKTDTCFKTCPSHSSRFYHPKNIGRGVYFRNVKSGLVTKQIRATRPAHLFHLGFITRKILGEEYISAP